MSLPTTQEKQKAALEEITRAMNLLLNEVVGTVDGGVKPETFDRARRAYDGATTALRGDMAEWARRLSERNPNAPGGVALGEQSSSGLSGEAWSAVTKRCFDTGGNFACADVSASRCTLCPNRKPADGVEASDTRYCGNCADGVPDGPDNCSKCGRESQYSHWAPATGPGAFVQCKACAEYDPEGNALCPQCTYIPPARGLKDGGNG